MRIATDSAGNNVVEKGYAVDPVHDRPPDQPHNPDQPR
jgi:hypothetical protein